MANITWLGVTYPDVPAIDLPKTGGGTARFADPSETTAVESDVTAGKRFLGADGTYKTGSGGGSGGIVISDAPDPAGGTVRTITAVEISGTKQITQNGQGIDVTEFAAVDVALPAGTEGTPTATKGAVSNHSVQVTPAVTNGAGVIEGGTKTGTPVTVSASELVSGSETKTQNGTYDVTNLAQLVVNVAASGGKAGQIQSKVARTNQTSYTDMGFEITVAKAGTYGIYWTGYRSNTGGTNGAQPYKNGSGIGSAITTFDGTYTNVQCGHVSGQSLAVGDKITIRARSRGNSYYMYVMDLAIIEE